MNFSADITGWCNKTELKGGVVLRKVGLEGYVGIMFRSPVKHGRFRASHRIGINKVDGSVEPPPQPNAPVISQIAGTPPSGKEMAYAVGQLSKVKWGDTIHITNNLPYAKKLEGGSSAQTNHRPDGIYGATFQELAAKIEATIKSVTLI